jgi:hypothetical protein
MQDIRTFLDHLIQISRFNILFSLHVFKAQHTKKKTEILNTPPIYIITIIIQIPEAQVFALLLVGKRQRKKGKRNF